MEYRLPHIWLYFLNLCLDHAVCKDVEADKIGLYIGRVEISPRLKEDQKGP